jgi:hypothetical protein
MPLGDAIKVCRSELDTSQARCWPNFERGSVASVVTYDADVIEPKARGFDTDGQLTNTHPLPDAVKAK